MKKFVALMMALVLCLSLASVAFAEEVETDITTLDWADCTAAIEAAGIEGDFVVMEDLGIKYWVPATLQAVEAPEDGNNYLAFYLNADQTFGFGIALTEPNEGLDYESYWAALEQVDDGSIVDMDIVVVNGLAAIVFTVMDGDAESANVMCMIGEDGSVLTFSFAAPSNDDDLLLLGLIAGSIQAAE